MRRGDGKPQNPFWNRDEWRLRALWRLVLLCTIVFIMEWIGQRHLARNGYPRIALPILLATAAYPLLLWILGKAVDQRPLGDFGLTINRRWRVDCAFGVFLGAAAMSLVFVIEYWMGWVQVIDIGYNATPWSTLRVWVYCASIYLLIAVREETVTRGYLMLNLAEGLRFGPTTSRVAVYLAWVISSVVFGLLHADNPNATVTSTLYLTIAGLMLGLPYLLTGSLAIPIGLHFSWNLVQGHVYGLPISGMDAELVTILRTRQLGPAPWTGGDFGPEAGYLGLIAMGLSMVAIWGWVRLRYGRAQVHHKLAEYEPTWTDL